MIDNSPSFPSSSIYNRFFRTNINDENMSNQSISRTVSTYSIFLVICLVLSDVAFVELSSFNQSYVQADNLETTPTKPMLLGLISVCRNQSKGIPLNQVGQIVSEKLNLFSKTFLRNDFIYKEIDICTREDLSRALVMMFTDAVYADISGTKVKHILTYMPEQMVDTLLSVISFSKDTIVWPLQTVLDQKSFRKHPNFDNFHQRVLRKPNDVILEMMEQFQWRNVHVVDIVKEGDISSQKTVDHELLFKKISRSQKSRNEQSWSIGDKEDTKIDNWLTKSDRCVSYSTYTITDIKNSSPRMLNEFKVLMQDLQKTVVFLHGAQNSLYKSKALENGLHKYWILFGSENHADWDDNNKVATDEHISILNSNAILHNHFDPFSDDLCLSWKKETRNECPSLQKRIAKMKENVPAMCIDIKQWNKDKTYRHLQFIQHTANNTVVTFDSMDDIPINNNLATTQKTSECPSCKHCKALCPSNKTLGFVDSGAFSKKVSWKCKTCPSNYRITGYGECLQCPKGTRQSARSSGCYDPVLKFRAGSSCFALTGVGLVVSVITIAVYSMYKKTPVVKSSNFELSLVQLISCILLHISCVVLNVIFEPSVMICTVRPMLYSTLLVALVSIVVCKAEKVLIIFFTKQRLSKKNIKDIKIRQLVIFGFLISINFILTPASFTLPASVKFKSAGVINGDSFYRKYCSSDTEFYIQALYAIAILVLAMFQGYRGRKLPTNYNEGNSILVASSMTIPVLVFCIWQLRYNIDSNPYNTLNTMWGSLSIALIFLVVCLYGVKVFVIIFQASKNTKKYQVNVMLADALKKTERQILNPLHNRHRSNSIMKLVTDKRRDRNPSVIRFRTLSIDDL